MSMQTCPHCAHRTDDVLDVLDNNTVHEMRACEQCGKPFYFATIDCDHCGNEQVFADTRQLVLSILQGTQCSVCQQTLARVDDGLPALL
jgi:hypothetical protein